MKNLSEIMSLLEYKIVWPATFALCKLGHKPDKSTVLFADPYSTSLTDNMKPIYSALEEKGGYNLICCFPKAASANKLINRFERSKTYIEFLKEYAKCGTLFLTESYLPSYAVKRRPGTNVVQLWHGSGAFKKWGYSTLDKDFGADKKSIKAFPMHNCYTLVPVSSPVVSPHYAEAFNCASDTVKALGVPRTDALFDDSFVSSARRRLFEACEPLKDSFGSYENFAAKKSILYAPTFRGKNITTASSGSGLDFEELAEELLRATDSSSLDDYVFLLKLHPFARDSVQIPDKYRNLFINITPSKEQADAAVDTNTVLCASDILITDYSSIIFEYSLLDRPMIFFAYDLELYKSERDFYYPYATFVPGQIAKTTVDLAHALINVTAITQNITDTLPTADQATHLADQATNITESTSAASAFASTYMSSCDGNSTERIINSI